MRGATEPLAFTAAVIIYIWFLRTHWPWSILILAAFVIASFIRHSENFNSLGLAVRPFVNAIIAWRWWLVATLVTLMAMGWVRKVPSHLVHRWFVYLAWCIFQQLLFQNMVYRRLRAAMGSSWKTALFAGALFGAVHIPNPILMPATLLWGTVSVRLFEVRPSIYFLGLCQALLSSIVYVLTPVALNHLFRVGPGYWAW